MISLHKSVVKQCKSLTSFSRQRGVSTSMYRDDSLSTSGKRTTNGSLLDDSSSRRRNYGSTSAAASAATSLSAQEPCYSTFLYHNHPSTPVTVGWVNFEQQQPGLANPNSAAAAAAALARRNAPSGARANPPRWARESNNVVNKDTFYGLPYSVDEPKQVDAAAAARPMHRAPIVAIEEDDDLECDDASIASSTAHSIDMEMPGVDGANDGMEAMNRNARRPKNANRGQRPVSRISRREKKRSIGNHRR